MKDDDHRAERTFMHGLRVRLRALYHGASPGAVRFRFAVIGVDLLIIAFFVAAPIMRDIGGLFLILDYLIAAILTFDLAARLLAQPSLKTSFKRPMIWVDLFILVTLLFPEQLANFGFLRVLRLWTLVESEFFWRTVGRRYDGTRVEEVTKAAIAKPRMMIGKTAGGTVRLGAITPQGLLGLCEGIETGLAVMRACPTLPV